MPFALEQVAGSQSPLVLYGFVDAERALIVKQRFFDARARTFVLSGGFQEYLASIIDMSTGEPLFGTVMDYDASALEESLRTFKTQAKPLSKVMSEPSLLDSEEEKSTPSASVVPTSPKKAAEPTQNNPSIEAQVSKYAGAKSASKRPEWASDTLCDSCPSCERKFTLTLRKHHCRACAQIFCFQCAPFFILLRDLDYKDPERVCKPCARHRSNADYLSNYTVYPCKQENSLKILLFGPELQTRKAVEPVAQALSERYTVISFELPGVGPRERESLTEESFIKTVTSAIDKYAVGGTPVILCGISMSAYGILKSLSSFKHRKVFGIVLVNAAKNYYQLSKLLLKGVGALYKIYPANRLWKFIVDEVGGSMPKEKMESIFLQNPIDYSLWNDTAAPLMCAPSADYYPKQIESFRQPVLWLGNKKDGKQDVEALSSRSAVQGTIVLLNSGRHAYATAPQDMSFAIDTWVEANKARLIIHDVEDSD